MIGALSEVRGLKIIIMKYRKGNEIEMNDTVKIYCRILEGEQTLAEGTCECRDTDKQYIKSGVRIAFKRMIAYAKSAKTPITDHAKIELRGKESLILPYINNDFEDSQTFANLIEYAMQMLFPNINEIA
jgi:hypothetical protein